MDNKIIVNILKRDYPLKVRGAEEEKQTRELAEYVDGKLGAIQQGLGSVSELTVAVIGALSLGEELLEARRKIESLEKKVSVQGETSATGASGVAVAKNEEFESSIKELSSKIKTVLKTSGE